MAQPDKQILFKVAYQNAIRDCTDPSRAGRYFSRCRHSAVGWHAGTKLSSVA